MGWLRNILSERDNKTIDLKRVAAATGVIGFHINESFALFVQHVPFDAMGYATAFAAILAALGAAIALGVKGEAPSQ